jgi:hypothetical protein
MLPHPPVNSDYPLTSHSLNVFLMYVQTKEIFGDGHSSPTSSTTIHIKEGDSFPDSLIKLTLERDIDYNGIVRLRGTQTCTKVVAYSGFMHLRKM